MLLFFLQLSLDYFELFWLFNRILILPLGRFHLLLHAEFKRLPSLIALLRLQSDQIMLKIK